MRPIGLVAVALGLLAAAAWLLGACGGRRAQCNIPAIFGDVTAAASTVAGAQSVLHEVWGPTGTPEFAEAVDVLGDLNQDGVPDYVVTDITALGSPNPAVRIHCGASGDTIAAVAGPTIAILFGESVAAGRDLDGDGVPDFIVGAPWGTPGAGPAPHAYGSVYVYSGATQQPIRQHVGTTAKDDFGWNVFFIDDIDQDGIPEYCIRSRYDNVQSAKLEVFSGRTGVRLQEHTPSAFTPFSYARDVAALGDVDQDGVSDFAIASPTTESTPGSLEGAVFLVSGSTGSSIATHMGATPSAGYGVSIEGLTDFDGDSVPDYATVGSWPSSALVVSSATAAVITAIPAESPYYWGAS